VIELAQGKQRAQAVLRLFEAGHTGQVPGEDLGGGQELHDRREQLGAAAA
jgi:hypothetical protein